MTRGPGAAHHVWVVGAGALGLLYADALSPTVSVTLVSRRVDWLRSLTRGYVLRGWTNCTVREPRFDLSDPSGLGRKRDPDVIIVLASGHDLEYVRKIVAVTASDAPVLSLQNGLGIQESLAAICPDRFAYGATYQSASLVAGHDRPVLEHWQAGRTIVGRCTDANANASLDLLAERMDRAAAAWERRSRSEAWREVWIKSALAAAMSPLSTLVDGPVRVLAEERLRWITETVLQEISTLAAAVDVQLDAGELARAVWEFVARSPDAMTSMTEHARAGRPIEAEPIVGYFLALGRQEGIPMPVTRTVHDLVVFGASRG